MLSGKIYCNNCGEKGHIFQNCIKPITSNGILLITKKEGENYVLMIRRKDTLGYVDFMRGKYNIHNIDFIQNLIDEMTLEEKERLKTLDFDTLWFDLWNPEFMDRFQKEKSVSKTKFDELKNGIMNNGISYSLLSIINNSRTEWTEPEWGFPKGRRNQNEHILHSSVREFQEETGYEDIYNISIIQNIEPIKEVFTGSNLKSYMNNYYLAFSPYIELDKFKKQKSEVSKIEWINIEDAVLKIRHYDIEKINMISKIIKILKEYSFII